MIVDTAQKYPKAEEMNMVWFEMENVKNGENVRKLA